MISYTIDPFPISFISTVSFIIFFPLFILNVISSFFLLLHKVEA